MAKDGPDSLLDMLVIGPGKKLLTFIGRAAVVAGIVGAGTAGVEAASSAGEAFADVPKPNPNTTTWTGQEVPTPIPDNPNPTPARGPTSWEL